MTTTIQQAYAPRPIRFLELLRERGWRIKVYGIADRRSYPASELLAAARAMAIRRLRRGPTRQRTHGVGFLGVHDGRGLNQVFLDLWVNDNELLHKVYVSAKQSPGRLTPAAADFNSVCVWDLYLQAFERQAWMAHVLANPEGPDLDAYLDARLDTEV